MAMVGMKLDVDTRLTESPRSTDDGDELTHLWCCDPDVALCGSDISNSVELYEGETIAGSPECIVCEDLEGTCPCRPDRGERGDDL